MGQGVSASPRPHSSSRPGWLAVAPWEAQEAGQGLVWPWEQVGDLRLQTLTWLGPGFSSCCLLPSPIPFSVATFGNYGAMLTRFEHHVF